MIDSRACVPVAGLRHLASPRPPGAECGSGERLCCRLGFRLWTASPDSFSRHCLITSTFNRFRTAQKPRDKPWLDGYRRVLSTAAQGELLTPERRAPKAGYWGDSDGRRVTGGLSVSAAGDWVCVCLPLCTLPTELSGYASRDYRALSRLRSETNTAISSGLPRQTRPVRIS